MATQDAILRIAAKTSGIQEVRALQGALGGLEKTASSMKGAFAGIAVALGAVGTIQIGGDLIKAANDAELVSRRIQAVAGSFGEVAGIYDIAAKASRQFAIGQTEAQSSVSNLYNRLRPMGVTLEQIETMFMGVNKAAALGGLTALDTSEAFRQLGQAMGSGRLQGDELRSLGERMPAVLQAVAKVMGVTVGEVKKLGSEGAITTDVLIKATQELNKLTPPEPTALARYKQAVDDLATTLGVGLQPIITPVIQGLTKVAQVLVLGAGWLKANKEEIKAVASETGAAIVVAAKLAAVTGVVVIAFKALNAALQTRIALQKASLLIETFAASLSPKRAAVLLASLAVGAVAVTKLEEKLKGIFANLPGIGAGAADIAESANKISTSIASAGSGLTAAEPAADALRKTEEDRAYWLERAGSAYAKQAAQIDLISAANQRRTALAGEENTLAQAYNNLGKTILQNRLELAKTDEEKLAISKQIAQIESESARLQLEATKLQIQAEQELKAAALNRAISNRKEIESTLALAAAMYNAGQLGMDKIQTYRQELEKATRAADTAQLEFNQAQRINNVKTQAANINYQASVLQATGGTQQAGGYIETAGPAYTTDKPRSYVTIAGMRIPQYAQGGFVTRRTLAEIGEGGEPEYVVPQSKAKRFANNILGGVTGSKALSAASSGQDYGYAMDKRGNKWSLDPAAYRGKTLRFGAGDSSTGIGSPRWQLSMARMSTGTAGMRISAQRPQVIIQTGPVQRRNDGDFVTLSDLEQTVASSVDQTMALFQKTAKQPSFRRRTGSR